MFDGCTSLTHTMYWDLHPDCDDIPTQVVYFPFNQALKQKIVPLLKEYSFMEAINKVIEDSSTSSKERYELLKYQQTQLSKDLSL